jgi:uncharacterized protein with ATP-grasp and redox domains
MTNRPIIHIPTPQRGDEPGTWAYKTVSGRFKNTARRILYENNFSAEIEKRLRDLLDDIPDGEIRLLNDPNTPDISAWQTYIEPYLGQTWHKPPWFFTENYFYRRIIEATGYFQSGEGNGVDPFSYQKRRGLEVSEENIHLLSEKAADWLEDKKNIPNTLTKILYQNLWGNQSDLSLWPAEGEDKPDHTDLQKAAEHIIVNRVNKTVEYLISGKSHSRIDFLIDNAGFELVSDLIFADYLLTNRLALTVRLHVKLHPTYVSDAMEKDVRATIEFLRMDSKDITRSLGERLAEALKTDRLQIMGSWFWTSPLDGWLMPRALQEKLGRSSLVISKGDAHYRRLLGDRHWPFTADFEDILAYYPTPLVALRTLKSELVVGLSEEQAKEISDQDPEWLINGRWGMIQHYRGPALNDDE